MEQKSIFSTNYQGFSRLRVVIGLVTLGLVSAAIFSLAWTFFRNNTSVEHRSAALQYAKEGIEGVRAFRAQNGQTAVSPLSGTYFLTRTNGGFVLTTNPADGNLGSGFTRSLVFATVNSSKKVTVTVSYTDQGQKRNVTLTTQLTSWL